MRRYFIRPYSWSGTVAGMALGLMVVMGTQSAHGQTSPLDNTSAETGRPREVFEGATLFYQISKTQPTRLVIVGGRVRKTTYIKQDIEVDKDEDTGQIFMSPLSDKPISLFVTTSAGTSFTLLLKPVESTARTISLTERLDTRAQPAVDARTSAVPTSTTHEQSISALLLSGASGRLAAGIDVQPINKQYTLWRNVKFVHEKTYTSPMLTMDQFSLVNAGDREIRMVEQEFFKVGVAAVAIEQHLLLPGDITTVYIIRNNPEQ